MATQHGKRYTYNKGCRCDECKDAEYSYQEKRRQTKLSGESGSVVRMRSSDPAPQTGPGPVEAAVQQEIADLAQTAARPGLAQVALALARTIDEPRTANQRAALSAQLMTVLEKLHKGADAKKSKLAAVREMTSAKSATG